MTTRLSNSGRTAKERIEIHQSLHGYRDGHQLLASSIDLDREQQWQMLVMSDLSGPSFRAGFESYLTGYPLNSGGLYCFARTWFAPELSRPGCVWTHSLIISETDVARIQDFRTLLSLFRRPENEKVEESGHYIDSILLDSSHFEGARPYKLDDKIASLLLHLLYSTPLRRVVIPSDGAVTYEEVVLAILNQQWPRLRRKFRFCTGALALRETEFDLAIAPPDAIRHEADLEAIDAIRKSKNTAINRHTGDDWIQVAVQDLTKQEKKSPLRTFLWKFGPDYDQGREVFRALCEIYLAASRDKEKSRLALSAIAHFFPDPNSSTRLKAEFFSINAGTRDTSEGESVLLPLLVTHPGASSIPDSIADIERRAFALTAADAHEATKIARFALSIGGVRGDQFLKGFSAGIVENSEAIAKLPISVAIELMKRRPDMAAMPAMWRRSTEEQSALTRVLRNLRTNAESRHGIVHAVLNARAWSSLEFILEDFGAEGVTAILEWIDRIPDLVLQIPEPVIQELRERPGLVIQAARNARSRSMRVVGAVLDPRSEEVRGLGASLWQREFDSNVHLSAAHDELRAAVFFLGVGLSADRPDGAALVRYSFGTVYAAARDGKIDDAVWSHLDPFLPWYHIDWDRCARLVRGAVRVFVTQEWPAANFVATFEDSEQLHRALEDADRTFSGARFIKGICRAFDTSPLQLKPFQRNALQEYCKS